MSEFSKTYSSNTHGSRPQPLVRSILSLVATSGALFLTPYTSADDVNSRVVITSGRGTPVCDADAEVLVQALSDPNLDPHKG
jgi:hypothetical protein